MPTATASIAVIHVGEAKGKRALAARVGSRSRTRGKLPGPRLARASRLNAWVDIGVPLAPGLESYTLVYLVGRGAFQLSRMR